MEYHWPGESLKSSDRTPRNVCPPWGAYRAMRDLHRARRKTVEAESAEAVGQGLKRSSLNGNTGVGQKLAADLIHHRTLKARGGRDRLCNQARSVGSWGCTCSANQRAWSEFSVFTRKAE